MGQNGHVAATAVTMSVNDPTFDCGKATACLAAAICLVQPSRFARASTVPSSTFILRAISLRPMPAAYPALICCQASVEVGLRTVLSYHNFRTASHTSYRRRSSNVRGQWFDVKSARRGRKASRPKNFHAQR